MAWKTFKDRLGLLVLIGVPALWVGEVFLPRPLSGEIIGASILAWGMVVQHYFRKKGPENT